MRARAGCPGQSWMRSPRCAGRRCAPPRRCLLAAVATHIAACCQELRGEPVLRPPLIPPSQMQGSVARSKRALTEIYETGANILSTMSTNKERLKVRAGLRRVDPAARCCLGCGCGCGAAWLCGLFTS